MKTRMLLFLIIAALALSVWAPVALAAGASYRGS